MFGLFSQNATNKRRLGRGGPVVYTVGLGCMGMSEFYGSVNLHDCIATLERALELGCNFFDTANIYGLGHNERLLGTFLAKVPRESYVLATKCGLKRDPSNLDKRMVDNSPEHIKQSCHDSLIRLGLDYIDLYYLHRIENNGRNIEDSMKAMAELLLEGKIHHVGLSEASKETIERANNALMMFTDGKHQLAAVQTEYSLMSRTPEIDGTMQICRELEIAFIPYAPLGRQFLTALNKTSDSYSSGDCRKMFPRFQVQNMDKNQGILRHIVAMAEEKSCSPAQLCLAWVLAKGSNVIPIPGTRHIRYLEENFSATNVELTSSDLDRLDAIAPIGAFSGARYSEELMRATSLKSDEEVLAEHTKTECK